MSLVPWTLDKTKSDIQNDQLALRKNSVANSVASTLSLPKRAAIVKEYSSDEEDNHGKHVKDIDASQGLAVSVMPSSLTSLQNAGLKVRQQETVASQGSTVTRLDELKLLAEKAGLSVEEQLESVNMPQNERSQKESTRRRNDAFVQETSQTNRDIGTNSREEVAYLVRESIQRVPTNNEAMATAVLKDILQARNQAAELNLKIEMRNPDQIQSLQMWYQSKKKPMCDLAEAILRRL